MHRTIVSEDLEQKDLLVEEQTWLLSLKTCAEQALAHRGTHKQQKGSTLTCR